MNYKKINLYLGWLVFLIATIVYFLTIEDTVSLWDCGEYITAAYKLEVGHPPGAPLFMVLGRLFSFFADPENVAVWINRLSGLSSSGTILFMFWSLTILVKKMVLKSRGLISTGDKIAIFGAAFVGSLAYAFTESFWFSAVEGEVYAMSSLFTAVIFWAILRWDEEMMEVQHGIRHANNYSPDRWLILIMFLLGLAIGVHLLGILVVPAIAFTIYFRYSDEVDFKGIFLVGILSVVILGFIQEAIIPGSISLASKFEVAFVNSLRLPFFSGSIFFFVLLIAGCVFALRYARKNGKRIMYSSFMGLIVLLIGYGSFAVIVIRSNANTPLDENNPENLVTLHSYLKREQYGSSPILTGPYFNSKPNPGNEWKDMSPVHLRRFVVRKGDKVLKAFIDESRANEYAKTQKGTEVKEMYFESNAQSRENRVPTYAQTTFFPRMYWSAEPAKVNRYKYWSGYDANDGIRTEKGNDGKRLPTFGENIRYFIDYQVNWMYVRYFMWNFAGRQNDIQGHGDQMNGNWLSGFSYIDDARLGDQGENAPFFTKDNPSYNTFFLMPLIFGLIGLFFHFYRAPKDAFVLFLAFLFTGLAIVVYLNQKPFEPRERDYAYAGSFYFFSFWIGIGVYALYEAFRSFEKREFIKMGYVAGAGLLATIILDISAPVSMPSVLTWLTISVISAALITLMYVLRKPFKENHGAIIATLLGLSVPVILGMQGWDDHDRSNKSTAHDLASNYLNSCGENGIIFTNGDNDTFPLWYLQEVEEKRTDVRVCNLSLMQTDWYTDQMKLKAYDSDPLPIKFTEDQILMDYGNTDQVYFVDIFGLFSNGGNKELIERVIDLRRIGNESALQLAMGQLNAKMTASLGGISASSPEMNAKLARIKGMFTLDNMTTSTKAVYNKFEAVMYILGIAQTGQLTADNSNLQTIQDALLEFEDSWSSISVDKAMEFVRDDANLWSSPKINGQVRIFPTSKFIIPVNKENALKSGVITEKQAVNCRESIPVSFSVRALTREEVMMLDIIANNDWERGIYFSSPGGSDVAKMLYSAQAIRQNGMAFEFSPLKPDFARIGGNRFNAERMYDNLMEKYEFGNMSDSKVLTDYYARRHTSQYRMHFLALAEYYVNRTLVPGVSPEDTESLKKRAVALINRSLEIMPAEHIIDYGEPTPGQSKYPIEGQELQTFNDGILHDYVRILYMAGDIEGAEKLGATVADQLESIINYFDKSDVKISASQENKKHFIGALEAYFQLNQSASAIDSNPDGPLSKRTLSKLDYVYKEMFPRMIDQLEILAKNNGERVRRSSKAGRYAKMMYYLEDYAQGMAVFYQMMEAPSQPQQQPAAGTPGMLPMQAP